MTQKDTGSAGYHSEYLGPIEDKPVAMSLRDYFAGQALAGLLANPNALPSLVNQTAQAQFSEAAYLNADAMIEARKETK